MVMVYEPTGEFKELFDKAKMLFDQYKSLNGDVKTNLRAITDIESQYKPILERLTHLAFETESSEEDDALAAEAARGYARICLALGKAYGTIGFTEAETFLTRSMEAAAGMKDRRLEREIMTSYKNLNKLELKKEGMARGFTLALADTCYSLVGKDEASKFRQRIEREVTMRQPTDYGLQAKYYVLGVGAKRESSQKIVLDE